MPRSADGATTVAVTMASRLGEERGDRLDHRIRVGVMGGVARPVDHDDPPVRESLVERDRGLAEGCHAVAAEDLEHRLAHPTERVEARRTRLALGRELPWDRVRGGDPQRPDRVGAGRPREPRRPSRRRGA